MTQTNSVQGPQALLIEDDDGVRRSLQLLLLGQGYQVRSYAAATPLLIGEVPHADVLVADYRLPDRTGVELMSELRRRGWSGRSILITAFPSPELVRAAKACGYTAVLPKPLHPQALITALSA